MPTGPRWVVHEMRRGGASGLQKLIAHQLGSLDLARKVAEHTAPLVWDEVVGLRIAEATEVLGINQGVLRVSARSASWAHELTFHRDEILRRLNRRLDAPPGAPIVRDIRFVNRGISRPKTIPTEPELPIESFTVSETELAAIDDSVSSVTDSGLRERMREARIRDRKMHYWRLAHGWISCPRCGDLNPPWGGGHLGECPRCRLLG